MVHNAEAVIFVDTGADQTYGKEDGTMERCPWCLGNEKMIHYHDEEWGAPVHDDRKQFEFLMMEVMQCGLNWNMMIQKREIFRNCFNDFDFDKVAAYGETDIERIMGTDGMIRSRRKSRQLFTMRDVFRRYGRSLVHSASISGDLPKERHIVIWATRKVTYQPRMVYLTESVLT